MFGKILGLFLILISYSITPQIILGHGLGQSYEKTVGDYHIEVEQEAIELKAEESVRFDFLITKKDSSESVEFTDVWVRIDKGNETIFASSIHNPEFGKTGMKFPFSKSGSYELNVRFQNKDENIAEASFPLTVVESQRKETKKEEEPDLSSSSLPIISGAIGLVGGYAISFLAKKKTKN